MTGINLVIGLLDWLGIAAHPLQCAVNEIRLLSWMFGVTVGSPLGNADVMCHLLRGNPDINEKNFLDADCLAKIPLE